MQQMTIKTLPRPKKPTPCAQSHGTAGRRTSPVGRIAHELINQLIVLNLVGHDLLTASGTGPAAIPVCDREIFERAIHDATLLAEQLADYLAAQQDNSCAVPIRIIREHGQVVRSLRSVHKTAIKLPPGLRRRGNACE
jgi:hypothetical protein